PAPRQGAEVGTTPGSALQRPKAEAPRSRQPANYFPLCRTGEVRLDQRRVEVTTKSVRERGCAAKRGQPGGFARSTAPWAGRARRACVPQGRSAKMPSLPASLDPTASRGRLGFAVEVFPCLSATFVL